MLGPYDKRSQRKRCIECRVRHLKCEGPNCKACTLAKRICVTHRRAIGPIKLDKTIDYSSNKVAHVPRTLPPIAESVLIPKFYSVFLQMNSFTGRPGSNFDYIHSLLRNSTTLLHAAMAIASLSVHREEKSNLRAIPLQCYATAVAAVQKDLKDRSLGTNYSVLWSTFFLGIFELMYDRTGDGWVMHFLHGTSELLNHFGPEACLYGPGRDFFLTVRVFEISRSLLFTSETFLSDEKWQALLGRIWLGDYIHEWHPKEELYNIMTSCSALGVRSTELISVLPQLTDQEQISQLQAIATEGECLRELLYNWRMALASSLFGYDAQMMLAITYYSATSIYLSGLYDYFTYWEDHSIHVPTLSRVAVEEHVTAILNLIASALKETNLAPILFLFPLRVVGARMNSMKEKRCVIDILDTISRRGFLVASIFSLELEELWKDRLRTT